jgi:hypothetical protein
MKWFDKWIMRKAEKISINHVNRDIVEMKSTAIAVGSLGRASLEANNIQFKVYKASGGTIIETSTYDRRTDRHNNGLYIITDDKDLGKEIGKIITMESLKS